MNHDIVFFQTICYCDLNIHLNHNDIVFFKQFVIII